MSFSRVRALATRIIQQVLRDKRTLGLIFLVPLLIMTLLYFVLTSNSTAHTLAIVYPTGAGSDRVKTLIDSQLPGPDKLHTIAIRADQVNSTLKNGDADAAIIFPADFARQVLNNQNPTVQIKLQGSDPTVASAMSDLTQSFAHQLGIAIAALKSQGGQGVPTVTRASLPFTVGTPQYLYG
ncbi:MAG TPA: ABC transporter permease, partial [Ktedonobacteraceae bacterium]